MCVFVYLNDKRGLRRETRSKVVFTNLHLLFGSSQYEYPCYFSLRIVVDTELLLFSLLTISQIHSEPRNPKASQP